MLQLLCSEFLFVWLFSFIESVGQRKGDGWMHVAEGGRGVITPVSWTVVLEPLLHVLSIFIF